MDVFLLNYTFFICILHRALKWHPRVRNFILTLSYYLKFSHLPKNMPVGGLTPLNCLCA